MIKRLLILLIVIAVCGGAAYGAVYLSNTYFPISNDEQQQTIDYWPEMPTNSNPNLKYFGYYHFADKISEVASYGHSNISKTDARNVKEIKDLYESGFYIFIMIRYVFFEDGETPADWSKRWEKAKTDIAPYMDKILGFYVDEPIPGKTKEAFHFACQTVLDDFPNKKMMSVMTYMDLVDDDGSRDYYQYCTDLAYDFYPMWNESNVRNLINKLETEIAVSNQNIWLVPKAFYTVDPQKDPYYFYEDKDAPAGEDIKNWIKGTYQLAVNDPRVVGIFCFVYDNGNFDASLRRFFREDDAYYNAEVFGLYDKIGKAVIANDKP